MKNGVTLVELLIVVAVIAILATMVIGVATRIDTQGKERLTKGTIAILEAALRQFNDYEYNYRVSPLAPIAEQDFYRGLDFPLDCNDFDPVTLQTTLANALGTPVVILAPGHDPRYSGSEVLYFLLSKVPESKKTLDKIEESLISNEDFNKQPMSITVGGRVYPLLRIIDPWDMPLRYDYYVQPFPFIPPQLNIMQASKRTFPVITSAGPDKIFGTADDISGRN